MNWKSFEEVVKYIYENIGLKSGLAIEGYSNNCVIKGKSGVSHQIDVLFSHSDGVHKYLSAVECKYWNQKIGKDIIMKMQAIISDCNIDKGIIVSKYGFTDSTIQYAKHYNIGLVELREPNQLDPEFIKNRIIINLKLHFNIVLYQITNLLIYSDRGSQEQKNYLKEFCLGILSSPIEDKIEYINSMPESTNKVLEVPEDEYDKILIDMAFLQLKAERCFVRLVDGSEKCFQDYIMEATEEKIYTAQPNTIVTYSKHFPFSTKFLNKEDYFSSEISRIKIEGRNIEKRWNKESQIRNYALMVMKVIFENKKFILKEDGSVVELDMV